MTNELTAVMIGSSRFFHGRLNVRHVKAHDFNRGGVNVIGVIIWNVNAIGLTPGPSPE